MQIWIIYVLMVDMFDLKMLQALHHQSYYNSITSAAHPDCLTSVANTTWGLKPSMQTCKYEIEILGNTNKNI